MRTTARVLLLNALMFAACTTTMQEPTGPTNLEELPTFVREGVLRAVIEIPAGSVDKQQYDPATNSFPVDLRNGKPRRITFLPYPANYGFIPGTRMDKAQGGDGDALDVFVLCGAVPSGTILEVEVIGVIELLDAGERDDKLVALPLDPALRTVNASDIAELPEAARTILVTWLLNYDPEDGAELIAVRGRQEAMATVERWRK